MNEKTIDSLIAHGNPVFLWTIDEEARLLWAKEKKPYGVISDEPYKARSVIQDIK